MQYLYFLIAIFLLLALVGEVLLYALAGGTILFVLYSIYEAINDFVQRKHQNNRTSEGEQLAKIGSFTEVDFIRIEKKFNILIDEMRFVLNSYGWDILTQKRFVNILKDLYPDTYRPNKFGALNAIITNDGLVDELTNCTRHDLWTFIDTKSDELSSQEQIHKIDFVEHFFALACIFGVTTKYNYLAYLKSRSSNLNI